MTSITTTTGHARRIVLLSAAILLATTLAGCTPVASGLLNEKPAAVTKTATPTTSYEAGAVVKADVKLPETQTAYPMADGTFVVVDNTKPLPAPVVADVVAGAAPAAALQLRPINHDFSTAGTIGQNERRSIENATAIMVYVSSKQAKLGKNIFVVFPGLSTASNNTSVTLWFAAGAYGPIGIIGGTQAATIAAAQALGVADNVETILIP